MVVQTREKRQERHYEKRMLKARGGVVKAKQKERQNDIHLIKAPRSLQKEKEKITIPVETVKEVTKMEEWAYSAYCIRLCFCTWISFGMSECAKKIRLWWTSFTHVQSVGQGICTLIEQSFLKSSVKAARNLDLWSSQAFWAKLNCIWIEIIDRLEGQPNIQKRHCLITSRPSAIMV